MPDDLNPVYVRTNIPAVAGLIVVLVAMAIVGGSVIMLVTAAYSWQYLLLAILFSFVGFVVGAYTYVEVQRQGFRYLDSKLPVMTIRRE